MAQLDDTPEPAMEIRVPEIKFIGEQDGPPELILKRKICECLEFYKLISRAYLPILEISGTKGVAVCLISKVGPDRSLVNSIGNIFKSIFNSNEHIDIIFPSISQEAEISCVCKPFFKRL